MRNTIITAGVFAAAMALNTVGAFGADTVNRAGTGSVPEGSQAITGKLVSLSEYFGTVDQGTASHVTRSTSSSSPTLSSPEPNRLGSQAGKSAGLGGVRSESSTSEARAQRDAQGAGGADRADSRGHATSSGSSNEQTLVLIAQQGPTRSGDTPLVALTSPTPGKPPEGLFRSEQEKLQGTRAMTPGGQVYILVFGDDAPSQSAYRKARGMVTESSSNWAASNHEGGDRIPVRGQDDARTGAIRDLTGSQQAEDTTASGRAGERDPSNKWSKTGSQVRVTGVLLDRGGLHAIRVSEISMDNMQSEPGTKNQGALDRNRPNLNRDGKPENNDKKSE